MFKELAENLDIKFNDINSRLIDFETKITQNDKEKFMPHFKYVDIINVHMLDEQTIIPETYFAIDEIFESVTGKYYMKVWDNGIFYEINIDKINSVSITFNDKESYIVNNWFNIKKQLERKEKIKRITKNEI